MDDITLLQGDCLDILPTLDAGSVDAIVTDPPFFRTSKEVWDRQWDTAESYLEWLGRVADEWKRILAPSGSLYVFASPRMAARVECLIADRFNVINAITWQKDFPCGALKYGAENFRGFVEMSERIIFAEHFGSDSHARGEAGYEAKCDELRGTIFEPLRAYLDGERRASGLTPEDCNEICGHRREGGMAGRKYFSRSQWCLPTPANYAKLREATGRFTREYEDLRREYEDLRREYEDLRREYEDLRRPFFAREEAPHTDVWTFKPVSQAKLLHPCQKPLLLLQHILSVSTRPGDLVLDSFAGSGSTLVACMKTGRRCIGIEIDPRYIPIINRRVKSAETPLFQGLGVDIIGE